MKEVRAYIQPLALGSLLQNRDDIPDFPVTVSVYEGFGRKNVGPGRREGLRDLWI